MGKKMKQTSKMARDHIVANGKLAQRKRQVLELVSDFPGRTHGELAALFFSRYRELGLLCAAETPHKRLPELEDDGLVYADKWRQCKETGKLARTWLPLVI